MSGFFLKIVNMSISAGWIVLAVLLLRLLLKKAPKWITVLLWGIVAIRLICPFTVQSVISLIPSAETISPNIMIDRAPEIHTGIPFLNSTINPVITGSFAPDPMDGANPLQIWIPIASIVWLAGIAALLAYTAISYWRLKRKIGTAVLLRDNIYQSETVVSPFVLGMIKPKIYLPFHISEQDMEHVIAHEKAHVRRKDHWWKPLGFLLLTLHWFNPLMWLGYSLLCRDIELACDEKVIKALSHDEKADYSQALLSCSVNRRMISACPLAFGEVGVKSRVKSVLNYKKPAFWIIILAVVACIAVAVCFLTDPKSESESIKNQKYGSELPGLSLEIVSIETSAPDPHITIRYTNGTSQDLVYGAEHYIYQKINDSWEDCRTDTSDAWEAIGYYLTPGAYDNRMYGLNGKIMSQAGTYRFETEFSIKDKPETKYKVWLEFDLTHGVDGITVHTFDPVALVYSDWRYSFVQPLETAPTYRIVNAMQLQEISADGIVTMIGNLERIQLSSENFDSRFMGNSECWLESETLDKLKNDNLYAWQQTVSNGDNHLLYILLEQKDGTFYLGFGYYGTAGENTHNPDNSHIRWLYRLENISASNVGGIDYPAKFVTSADIEKLKAKYPMYFDLSAAKGLEVYVWQMAAESYSCGLLPGKNLVYAQEELWELHKAPASMEEMQAIIAYYIFSGKVTTDEVMIQAIQMPHSSYFYTIDDDYFQKLNELFWSALPIVGSSQFSPIIDTATFDIDGDGRDEQCSLHYGPTSGLFTFIFSASENGVLEYFNIFNSPHLELSFEKDSEGQMRIVGKNGDDTLYMGIDVYNGNIVISSDEQDISYWGEQGVDSPYVPKS